MGPKETQEDGFAETLQIAQFGRSGDADLAIAISGEAVAEGVLAGRVAVLYGSNEGVTATAQQSWSQASPRIRGKAEEGDGFGTLGH